MPDIFINPEKTEPETEKGAEAPTPKEEKEDLEPKSAKNPFSASRYRPEGVDFETKADDEEVILLIRKHFATNFKWLILALILLLAPSIYLALPTPGFLPPQFQLIIILCWYLVTFAFIIQSFLGWFYNVDIVTDKRIVDINFYNLMYKEISVADIDKIQDVTYKIGGISGTMLNYGDVFVQTAGSEPNVEILGVPKPERVAKIFQDLREEGKAKEA